MTWLIRLESEGFDSHALEIAQVDGHEAIGRLFEIELLLAAPKESPLDTDKALGAAVVLVFEQGERCHRMPAMVRRVEDLLTNEAGFRAYRLWLAPRAHRLSLVKMQDIFLGDSVVDVVREKLTRVGLGEDVETFLAGTYPKLEFVLQYAETDLDFVSRLCEHAGISMVLTADDTSDRVALVDHAEGFPALADAKIPFRGRGDKTEVFDLTCTTDVTPDTFVVQDYNYRTPTIELTAEAPITSGYGGGVVEFGGHFATAAEAVTFAKQRADGVDARQTLFSGASSRPDLRAGHRFTLEDHPHLGNVELLVTEVTHSARQPALGAAAVEGEGHGYSNRFRATLASRTFRPECVTPKPYMAGVYLGLIQPVPEHLIGPSAQLDEEGRYWVRFLFDSQPRQGPTSHRIRMAQPHAGAGHGLHYPLRPGVEVAIAFTNGDPDRPLILGAVPNPITRSPTTRINSKENLLTTASGIRVALRDCD